MSALEKPLEDDSGAGLTRNRIGCTEAQPGNKGRG